MKTLTTMKSENNIEETAGSDCQQRLVRLLPIDRKSDELRVWPASQFKPDDMVLDKAQGEKLKILAVENEMCHQALKNLSACCWGQTLTQSVAGAAELIRAFRDSDKRLRDALEAIRGLRDAENILAIINEALVEPSNSSTNADVEPAAAATRAAADMSEVSEPNTQGEAQPPATKL